MAAAPRLSMAILGSRFGRRLFVLFCLAALVPASVVFWMTYRTASADAEDARREALRAGAKNYALGVFERLQLAGEALSTVDTEAIARGGADALLGLYFSDVRVRPRRADDPPAGTARSAGPRLRLAPGDGGTRPVLEHAEGDRVVVGMLAPDFLWGLASEMSQNMRICLYAVRERLFCGGHPGTDPGERLVSAHWDLFLKAGFDAPPWTAVSVADAGHGLGHYRGVVVPAAAAVLLLALLLSSVQIRRVLVPLSDLLRRIQGVEGGHAPVAQQSGEEEFALLTRTFDAMQQRIGRQIDTLRILSDIDRLLLGGASLDQLLDLIARRLRHLAQPALVCIVVPPPVPSEPATLHLLRCDGGAVEQRRCRRGCIADEGSPQGRWQAVDALEPGLLHEACEADAVRALFVLRPAELPRPVQVVLGYAARPAGIDEALAQAAKLAESIPVALAFEERRRQLVYQARHDSLTQLPNRLATFEAVSAAIEDAERDGARFAVAFLDLDRFKSINDGLGHGSGDEMLVGVSHRIRNSLSAGDFVGRFGGDEFCLILFGAGNPGEAEHAMQRVAAGLSRTVQAGGREFLQSFSAGIALYPEHGRDASTLIRHADLAMYQGKRAGGRALRVFEPDMDAAAQARLRMENDLRDAIAADAIEVHYQPRVDSRDGSIVGAEALARWNHPGSGAIPPPVFIALAEDTGLIDALGALMLRKACAQLAEWNAAGLDLKVSVNVSGHQLRSRRLAETVQRAVEAAGIAPAALELELTETALVEDREAAEHQLGRVRAAGTTVAIDDFGTGYSSLAYLAALPFDTLKIDRSFVVGIGDGDTPMSAIVRATIGLARELGKHVVAEGVETLVDVQHLAGWGCPIIQGYVYHRPMPAAALTDLLRARASTG